MEALKQIALKEIQISKNNPRRSFDPQKLQDLTNSIKEKGIIEPLIVRTVKDNQYEVICGERRLKAAEMAGLKDVPAIIKNITDDQSLEFRIIENLQREDLNPIEEALGFKTIIERCKYTQADLSSRVGKSQAYIANRMRLLDLSKDIQEAISREIITPGHGVVILRLKDPGEQKELFTTILQEKLSIRAAENAMEHCGLRLDNVPFDTTACQKCDYNGTRQKDLFDKDTNLKGRCLNKECYKQKVDVEINRKITELRKKGLKVVSEDKIKSELGGRKFENSITLKGRWGGAYPEIGKAYKQKCKAGCEHFVCVIEKRRNDDEEISIEELCTNPSCFKALKKSKTAKSGGADNYSKELAKVKTGNRIREAKRAFWINKVATAKNTRAINAIMLDILLNDLGMSTANELLPFKKTKAHEWGRSWDIKKLYELGEEKIKELIVKVISEKTTVLDDNSLSFLATTLGFDVKKHFVITEAYLNAHTKDQLIQLSDEIGLTAYLRNKKICDQLGNWKKSDLIKFFLKKGFTLEGKVPKEMTK